MNFVYESVMASYPANDDGMVQHDSPPLCCAILDPDWKQEPRGAKGDRGPLALLYPVVAIENTHP